MGIEYESVVDHPLDRGVRLAHPARRDAAAGAAVAADEGGGRGRLAGRRAGGARAAGRAALGRAARPGGIRSAAPIRRRAVLGGSDVVACRGSSALAAHARVQRGASGAHAGARPRRHPVPAAALRRRSSTGTGSSPTTWPPTATPRRGTAAAGRRRHRRFRPGRRRVVGVPEHRRAPGDPAGAPSGAQSPSERQWNPDRPAPDLLSGVDAVVHLAGRRSPGRFTDAHKAAHPRQPHRAHPPPGRGRRCR